MRQGRKLSIVSASLPLLILLTGARGPDSPPPTSKQLEAWWADLQAEDFKAARALLNFADHPAETVPFLKEQLKPLKLDAVKLKAFLLRLGSDNETLWKGAFEDLEYYDPRLAMDLPALMDKVTEAPARQRMVEIMSGRDAGSLGTKKVELRKFDKFYNFFADNGSWWAEPSVAQLNTSGWMGDKRKWTRAVRAIALLEHLHTPEAVAILKDLATGHPDAQPTRAAAESLKRIEAAGK